MHRHTEIWCSLFRGFAEPAALLFQTDRRTRRAWQIAERRLVTAAPNEPTATKCCTRKLWVCCRGSTAALTPNQLARSFPPLPLSSPSSFPLLFTPSFTFPFLSFSPPLKSNRKSGGTVSSPNGLRGSTGRKGNLAHFEIEIKMK